MKALTSYWNSGYDDFTEVVTVRSYDRNKYCYVRRQDGSIEEVKTGYLRLVDGKYIDIQHWVTLPREYDSTNPTRKQQAQELREYRKHRTSWWVAVTTDNTKSKRTFKHKADALRFCLRHLANGNAFHLDQHNHDSDGTEYLSMASYFHPNDQWYANDNILKFFQKHFFDVVPNYYTNVKGQSCK